VDRTEFDNAENVENLRALRGPPAYSQVHPNVAVATSERPSEAKPELKLAALFVCSTTVAAL